ncbi:MAG: hypothetical protein EXR72_07110 [Myxococcales bacterium]|nr:hypothetical protein [Myxococcales bacterium]
MRALVISLFLVAAPRGSSALAEELKCGPHQHVVVEKDEDEGATRKRCACDEGWDAEGPGRPCKEVKAAPAKAPPKKK